jgi:hypothetical protein
MGKRTPESEYEELEGAGWNGTIFADPITKEYTTNCLSFDLNGQDVLIDVVGTGLDDTCNRRIVIPVAQRKWDDWLGESVWTCNNGLKKIPRFWKLRAYPKNFTASSATMNWMGERIRRYWNRSFGISEDACQGKNSSRKLRNSFRGFYCSSLRCDTNVRDVMQLRAPLDKSLKNKMDWYNFALMKDMGAEWFDKSIASDGMNFFIPPACEVSRAVTADAKLKSEAIAGLVVGCLALLIGVIGIVIASCACCCPKVDKKDGMQV